MPGDRRDLAHSAHGVRTLSLIEPQNLTHEVIDGSPTIPGESIRPHNPGGHAVSIRGSDRLPDS